MLFRSRINRSMYFFGNGTHCATMLIAKFKVGSDKMEICSAGHEFPFVLKDGQDARKMVFRLKPSAILGMTQSIDIYSKDLELPVGGTAVFYSDGLFIGDESTTETRRRAAIKRHVATLAGRDPRTLVRETERFWRRQLGATPAADDLCLMAIRRLAG